MRTRLGTTGLKPEASERAIRFSTPPPRCCSSPCRRAALHRCYLQGVADPPASEEGAMKLRPPEDAAEEFPALKPSAPGFHPPTCRSGRRAAIAEANRRRRRRASGIGVGVGSGAGASTGPYPGGASSSGVGVGVGRRGGVGGSGGGASSSSMRTGRRGVARRSPSSANQPALVPATSHSNGGAAGVALLAVP